jgi:hypothetical protein
VFYCSSDHQRQHWKTHKKTCQRAPPTASYVPGETPEPIAAPSVDASFAGSHPAEDSLEERARQVFASIAKMKVDNAALDQRIDQTVSKATGAKVDLQSYELAFKVCCRLNNLWSCILALLDWLMRACVCGVCVCGVCVCVCFFVCVCVCVCVCVVCICITRQHMEATMEELHQTVMRSVVAGFGPSAPVDEVEPSLDGDADATSGCPIGADPSEVHAASVVSDHASATGDSPSTAVTSTPVFEGRTSAVMAAAASDSKRSFRDPSAWIVGLVTVVEQATWLVDCYRMRIDDEYTVAGGNRVGPNDPYRTPASVWAHALVFARLAVARGVLASPPAVLLPEFWPSFTQRLAAVMFQAFGKEDAKRVYGRENVFTVMSGGRSLRFTAEMIYDSGVQGPTDKAPVHVAMIAEVAQVVTTASGTPKSSAQELLQSGTRLACLPIGSPTQPLLSLSLSLSLSHTHAYTYTHAHTYITHILTPSITYFLSLSLSFFLALRARKQF